VLFVLCLCLTSSSGFSIVRRTVLQSTMAAVSGGLLMQPNESKAVIESKVCTAGVGDGCDDLAEGNEFIKSLQRKSAENREANLKDATLAYQIKNYPDVFASLSPPKFMVMKADGSGFLLMTAEELEPLKQKGKIKLEKGTAFGGKTQDMTRKNVLRLVE